MDVFALRRRLVDDYAGYIRSFIQIRDERIRALVDDELDGAFLHLYLGPPAEWTANGTRELLAAFSTPRAAAEHILDTFPIVRRKDEAVHGDYRTKRLVLKVYDALQRAVETGVACDTSMPSSRWAERQRGHE